MWNNLVNNLTKAQKIGALVIIQAVFIIVIVAILNAVLNSETQHMVENNESAVLSKDIPGNSSNLFENQLWNLVAQNTDDLTRDNLEYLIREDTYELVEEDGVKSATFLVDIDSLKQTYSVSIGWNSDGSMLPDSVLINCPPQNLMKYPETICYGMYNNTYSLDLYLPYTVESDKNYDYYVAPNIYIDGNEYEKTITIAVSICNPEKFKKEAIEYLESTPIKLKEYTINYEIDDVNAECD